MTEQVKRYRSTAERLLNAIEAQCAARAAYEAARDQHDDRRMTLLLEGIPDLPSERCNAEVREAALSRALMPQILVLRSARDSLRRADAELEAARIAERAERETLRSSHYLAAQ